MKRALASVAVVLALLLAGGQAHALWFGKDRAGELMAIFDELDLGGAKVETVRRLEGYVEKNSVGEYMDEALLRLGRIYEERKELGKAAEAYGMLLKNFPQSRFRSEASYELGLVSYRTGRLDEARAAFESISGDNGASLAMRARAQRLLKEIERATYGIEAPSDLPAIGVLLPLKGDYAGFGEEALSGVLMAAGVFGPAGARFEVIVKDISEASSVEAAVRELAANDRVVGVLGPLLSSTALEAAMHAQSMRLPVITLSQREGITDAGEYVFRNFLTPESQARAIAGYAAGPLKARRFAVLHPQSAYGVELARHFEAAVRDSGGSVVRQGAYAPGTTDFSETVRRVFGVQTKERTEGRRKIREFIPTVQVDALFVPDSYDAVALMVPYLDYYDIKGVRLLGAGGWNSPRLVELGGRGVEGAVFVDGFFAASSRGAAAEFSRGFSDTFGRQPGILSAQAFDAASMLLHAASASGGGAGREGVKEALRSVREFRGATGDISFSPRREAVKDLFVLTVQGGRIVEAGK